MLVLAREGACPRAGDDGRREDLAIRCRGRAGQGDTARLQAEGTPAPRGGEVWDDHVPYSGGKNLSIVVQRHLQPERLDVLEIELICRLL